MAGRPRKGVTPLMRFLMSYKEASSGCWEWLGGQQPYGRFYMGGFNHFAHRAAILLLTDTPLSNDMTVDHLCSNTRCVNPKHLEVVSIEENMRRAARRDGHMVEGDPVCPKGHAMTAANTTMRVSSHGNRRPRCRRCINDYKKKARGTL